MFTASPTALASWEKLFDSERQMRQAEGVADWKKWTSDNAADIVEMGGPLSRTKKVNENGVADIRNILATFMIVRAESHEAVANLFLNHPQFAIFPSEGVEAIEALPIPGS